MPTAYRVEPLEDALLHWLTTGSFSTNAPDAGDQGEEQGDDPSMDFHEVISPLCRPEETWAWVIVPEREKPTPFLAPRSLSVELRGLDLFDSAAPSLRRERDRRRSS
jgi:hypothetical protein